MLWPRRWCRLWSRRRRGERIQQASRSQIVHFHESNPGGVVHATRDRRVVARWQVCDNRRFPSVTRCVTAVLDFLHLVMGDNPADDGSLPVIIRGNQSASAIVQFQDRISQWIGNAILTELRANGADNHSLGLSALHNKATNHHVVARLHKGARTNVAKMCLRCRRWGGCRSRWSPYH